MVFDYSSTLINPADILAFPDWSYIGKPLTAPAGSILPPIPIESAYLFGQNNTSIFLQGAVNNEN